MSFELLVAHCPECGSVFQKNIRNLCTSCSSVVDDQMLAIEKYLLRNRMATTEELADGASTTVQRSSNVDPKWKTQNIRLSELNRRMRLMSLCDSKGPFMLFLRR